jgi:tetratricopeptide (TPR) repeat protein
MPELVEVRDSGAPSSRWQQPFDAALTDVFQVQSDIASRVAQALGVALGADEEKRLTAKPTQNLAAYEAFLKGEEVLNRLDSYTDQSGFQKALGFYEQAVALDPGFAQAWAKVSRASSFLSAISTTPRTELAERARLAADKAVALAPSDPEGYMALGNYQLNVINNSERGLEYYARALRLSGANADLFRAMGVAESALGHWGEAVERLTQAERLDPRSVDIPLHLGLVLLHLRRYPEARSASDRGLALRPAYFDLIVLKAATFVGEADLENARAVLKAAARRVQPTDLVASVVSPASYEFCGSLAWLLDDDQRALLLRLTPTAFNNDRAAWGLALAQMNSLQGDEAHSRAYAEEARKAIEEQLRAAPDDAQRHVILGLALAYLGRKEEAIREGERGVALDPVLKDASQGPYFQHQLVRIYMLVGEPEKALDQLEPLLKIPYLLSPGWLKIDPNFDPLRKNPRFQKLVAGGK